MVLTFERCVAAQGKKGGGGDKVGAFFSAIRSEKLDTVRSVLELSFSNGLAAIAVAVQHTNRTSSIHMNEPTVSMC